MVETWVPSGSDKAEGPTTSQPKGFMVATMNPFMTEQRGFHPEERFVRRIRYPVLCMQTNQPNQRPPNHNHHATQLDRSVALPVSFAWWERYFVYSQGPRVRAISAVAFRHQSLGDADTARQSHRSARTKRELKGLAVLLTRAPIMKVAARHEAESKMDDPLCGSWRGCRRHRCGPVPEMLSGSLRWRS